MVLVIGHRGASFEEPENTLGAFALALRHGAAGVELDARLTADGVLVVHHDPVWPPDLPGVGSRAGSAVAATFATARPTLVPTLDEALDACRGALVNIELKSDHDPDRPGRRLSAEASVQALTALLRRRSAGDRVLVSSFDLDLLDAFQARSPGTSVGWLTDSETNGATLEALAARGHRSVHPRASVTSGTLIAQAHRVGLAVYTWTVDDPADARRLAAAGVDAIITNAPASIAAALRSP